MGYYMIPKSYFISLHERDKHTQKLSVCKIVEILSAVSLDIRGIAIPKGRFIDAGFLISYGN